MRRPPGQSRRVKSIGAVLYDTFAIVTRSGRRPSPGVPELLMNLEGHMRAVADAFHRSRTTA